MANAVRDENRRPTLIGVSSADGTTVTRIKVNPTTHRMKVDLLLPETTTPDAVADNGQIYTKSDNKLYFQDGAGVEHTVAFV